MELPDRAFVLWVLSSEEDPHRDKARVQRDAMVQASSGKTRATASALGQRAPALPGITGASDLDEIAPAGTRSARRLSAGH